ncbi:MAG: acyltransferase [Deltaproteobacteria bacterium]|nr:acyltransferase [Deltaproteobacteria bacterium]
MFGTFRYLLALLVVLIHVWPGFMLWTGVYAVFAFYALSGYLMALVLDRSYEPTRAGTLRYFANRGLRIYPPYFAALVLAAVIGLMDPVTARNIGQIHPPENALEWLRNLFIFTLHLERAETNRLISLAWSVDIELWFYVAMGLGLGRGRYRIAIWFLLSLAYTVFMVAEGYPFPPRYSTIAAASLPYSLGALLYSQQGHLRQFLSSRWHAPLAFALFFVNAVFSPSIGGIRSLPGSMHRWRWRVTQSPPSGCSSGLPDPTGSPAWTESPETSPTRFSSATYRWPPCW